VVVTLSVQSVTAVILLTDSTSVISTLSLTASQVHLLVSASYLTKRCGLAFSALMLLVGCQEEPQCSDVVWVKAGMAHSICGCTCGGW